METEESGNKRDGDGMGHRCAVDEKTTHETCGCLQGCLGALGSVLGLDGWKEEEESDPWSRARKGHGSDKGRAALVLKNRLNIYPAALIRGFRIRRTEEVEVEERASSDELISTWREKRALTALTIYFNGR